MEDYNEFHKVLDSLISLNIKRRLGFSDIRKNVGDVIYAMEFCTIKCDIGRRSGKTEYINRRAKKDDLVIVGSLQMKNYCFKNCGATVVIPSFFEKPIGGRFEIIYIDEPTRVLKNIDLKVIYDRLAFGTQTFVLLGA